MSSMDSDIIVGLRFLVDDHITIANFPDVMDFLDESEKNKAIDSIRGNDRSKWLGGRANLPVRLILESEFNQKLLAKILKAARYTGKGSDNAEGVKLPLEMDNDFAYFLGVLAGDGYISKPKPHQRSWWTIQMCEDDYLFQTRVYSPIVEKLFGYKPLIGINARKDGRINVFSRIDSFVIATYLISVIGLRNGYKTDIVSIPQIIIRSDNKLLRNAFVSGLFDTDGTVSEGRVRFSSVSKRLVEQVREVLIQNGIHSYVQSWVKNEKSKELYTIRVSTKDLKKFDELIGFRNIRKKAKLKQLIAPSSSGQG